MQPFGRNRHGPKIGGLCPIAGGGAGSPSNTMWPEPRPTCTPSFILIRPTVWPQCTNVTDRQDRTERQTDRQTYIQRSDSIGRTVLQMVAQKHPFLQLISLIVYVFSRLNLLGHDRPRSSAKLKPNSITLAGSKLVRSCKPIPRRPVKRTPKWRFGGKIIPFGKFSEFFY